MSVIIPTGSTTTGSWYLLFNKGEMTEGVSPFYARFFTKPDFIPRQSRHLTGAK